ncbi:Hypothetical protein FKW44_024969, partial [Caligus rogercresseyi]
MADSFNDARAPTGVREDEGTSLSNTLEFGGRIPDSLAASQEVQDQSGEANIDSELVVQPLEPQRGKYSPEQCPIIGAGPWEKQEWAQEMSSYDEELTTALAGLPPLEAKARKEKNLRHAAQGMAAYLKAKEDGSGIVRDVLRMTDKICRNPTLANDIKAGE